MFIDINKIGAEGFAFERPLQLADLRGASDEAVPVLAARLRGRAAPGERGVDLCATLEARVVLTCSRCLEGFESSITRDFFLILVAAGGGVEEQDEVTAENAALFEVEDGRAALAAIALEQIYLELPLKPVCDETCRGLCPTCGANRNRLECGCAEETVDPRLAPLQALKHRLKGL